MIRLNFVWVGLCAALTSSCAVSLCDKDPTDPRCLTDQVPTDGLSVSPLRLSQSGVKVTVRLGDGPGTVTLKQGDKQLAMGSLSDGVLEANLTGAMFQQATIAPGAAQVVVSRSGKADEAQHVRVYAEPQFAALVTYDVQPTGETPESVMVQPGGGLWAFQSFPRASGQGRTQHLVSYQLSGGQLVSGGPAFGNYPFAPWTDRPARAAFLAEQSRIVAFGRDLYAGEDAIQTDGCTLAPERCDVLAATLDFQKILGLTSQGSMIAVQTDAEVQVYKAGDTSPLGPRQTVTGGQSARAGQKIALGDLNGDRNIDLITVATEGVHVFLGLGSGGFQWDATLGSKLTAALPGGVSAIACADVDRDGLADVVVATGSTVQVITPLPNGGFVAAKPIAGLDQADHLTLGPVDGKTASLPDIALSSSKLQRIGVILNETSL